MQQKLDNYFYALLFLCLFSASCGTPDFNPTIEWEDPKLVIYGYLSEEEGMSINVTKSVGVIANGDLVTKLDDPAVVTIEDLTLGTSWMLTTTDTIIYSTTVPAEIGHRYRLEVAHPEFPDASAETYIPRLFNAIFEDSTTSVYQGATTFTVDMEIFDGSTEDDFFIIEATLRNSNAEKKSIQMLSFDEKAENDEVGTQDDNYKRIYLTDAHFNNESYTTELVLDTFLLIGDTIKITTFSVSPSIYKYFKAFDKSTIDPIGLNYIQPINIDSNIENGFGFFGGRSCSAIEVFK